MALATRITAENARFNVGEDLVVRTINVPTFTLDLLHPRHRAAFLFRQAAEERIDGRQVWRVEFRERPGPTIIRTPTDRDQPARGSFWVDPVGGAVIRTQLNVTDDRERTSATIVVNYHHDPRLAILVPTEMRETYNRPTVGIHAWRHT